MIKIESIKKLSSNRYELIIAGKKHIILGDVLLGCHIFKSGDITEELYQKILHDLDF